MIEPEWMKFQSTGSITDYLSYKGYRASAESSMAGQEERGRSVEEYGTDHSADRHGTISSPGGRI